MYPMVRGLVMDDTPR